MAKDKQHVFSARTTEAGLKKLNELKEKLGVSLDDLIIDAVSAHYELDRLAMQVPKAYRPDKKAEPKKRGAEGKRGKGGKKDSAKKVHATVTPAEAA